MAATLFLVAPPAWAADERRIHHARLQPATPDGAWTLQRVLEDALRCACFDDFGRLVLVRRLRIGNLPPRCDSLRLTAALERAWRAAACTAVPALAGSRDPALAREACNAEVVWFTSPFEARLAALARLLDGAPLEGWFWPRAVPLLDGRILATRDTPFLTRALLEHLTTDPRTAHLTTRAIADWPLTRQQRLHNLLPSPLRPSPQHWSREPSAAARATPAARDSVSGNAGWPLARIGATHASAPTKPDPRPPTSTPTPTRDRRHHAGDACGPASAPKAEVDAAVPAAQAPARPRPARDTLRWPWLRDARFTAHGGVLWLLNLLPAIGFGASTTRPLPLLLVRAVLAGCMDRVGVPPDDPQRDVLPPWPASRPEPPPKDNRDARQWQARARRALRRHAHLSLVELAQRPAWVTVTPTHADIVLPMATIDLRVRRCGLDCDPGWVPWLGRIVAFHFVARQDWPEPENT